MSTGHRVRPADAVLPRGARALVVGFGVSGQAAARLLVADGVEVVALDDASLGEGPATAAELGVQLVERPDQDTLRELVAGSDVVVPSPGVPPRHGVFAAAAAAGVPLLGEVELAWRRARVPVVAVTGTNGKTTVTALVSEMLAESGLRSVAAGNIGLPLSDAVGLDADVLVVEVSSFQLEMTERFRPAVAVWLNVADDHLDWHPDLQSYAAAKARIWANQRPDDLAVANADDPLVREAASRAPGAVRTFGLRSGHYRLEGGVLRGPEGDIVASDELPRRLPHDLANALAASAAALAAGGHLDGVRTALRRFGGLPHRLTLVGESGGVRWYDDSKATNPAAALAAVRGFDSVVLLAGGRNKGLDLGGLATAADRIRGVVALGEAAPEVEAAFAGRRPVTVAPSMDEAVGAAAQMARPGDVVLLSPGCASFDWYRNYAERGDDFARAVRRHLGHPDEAPTP